MFLWAQGRWQTRSGGNSVELETFACGLDQFAERLEARVSMSLLVERYNWLRRPRSARQLPLG
jgi:hypothetical protein